jgi:hypothetical protein
VKHNGRPPLLASKLTPNLLILSPYGGRPVVACPDCGTWRVASRGMLPAHRAEDDVTRCPGSGQRVQIDLTYGVWRTRLAEATRETALRRGTRVQLSNRPPLPFRVTAG